jgi:hypothetical protein
VAVLSGNRHTSFLVSEDRFMRASPVIQFVLFASVLSLCGCASNNKGKIEGTKWSSLRATKENASLPAGTLKMEFHSDGKLVYQLSRQTYLGTYSLGSGDSVTMTFERAVSGRKSHTGKIKIVDNQMTVTESDGSSILFEKIE